MSSLERFWPDPWDTLSEVALFFEKMHKVFKIRPRGAGPPLKLSVFLLKVYLTKVNLLLCYANTVWRGILVEIQSLILLLEMEVFSGTIFQSFWYKYVNHYKQNFGRGGLLWGDDFWSPSATESDGGDLEKLFAEPKMPPHSKIKANFVLSTKYSFLMQFWAEK